MDPIPGINTQTATAGAAANEGPDNELGKGAFLQLLVAQLRYQNPLQPADSQQFMAQTAQFTSVEKLEEIAASMASLTKNDDLATIGNLVGKRVQFRDSIGNLQEAKVTAGKIDSTGIKLVLGEDEIRVDDIVAVLAAADEGG
jgi:flagellar basal-body rod modification protein FlgD